MTSSIELLTQKDSQRILPELEALFSDQSALYPDFSSFLDDLLEIPLWRGLAGQSSPYRTLCIELAQEIDHFADDLTAEPAYHSRKHFQDVCIAMSLLLQQHPASFVQDSGNPWNLSKDDACLLLLCAIGHDFSHTGAVNQQPFELEKASIAKLKFTLRNSALPVPLLQSVLAAMEPIILSTDPAYFDQLVDRSRQTLFLPSHQNCLSMLMIEADLMASVLPMKGAALAERLAVEWRNTNPEKADFVTSLKGRLAFLRQLRFISPLAKQLGLETIRFVEILRLENAAPPKY